MQILQSTMQKDVCNIGLIFEMLNYSVIKQGTPFWEINIKKKQKTIFADAGFCVLYEIYDESRFASICPIEYQW